MSSQDSQNLSDKVAHLDYEVLGFLEEVSMLK